MSSSSKARSGSPDPRPAAKSPELLASHYERKMVRMIKNLRKLEEAGHTKEAAMEALIACKNSLGQSNKYVQQLSEGATSETLPWFTAASDEFPPPSPTKPPTADAVTFRDLPICGPQFSRKHVKNSNLPPMRKSSTTCPPTSASGSDTDGESEVPTVGDRRK
uniref:Uncharacterized protein n=1 Tax=Spongospora subterranea TaxID=70186 RepID=A0A0H5RA12_9EUKA|eukprot:CRZ10980.1 hypothetical protein [Spongospora subterranea]